jgi:hypothetical protein
MGDMTMKLELVAACGKPEGDVAYLRMPLALSAMDALNRFVEKAYGKDCVCTEEPKGWLKVSTHNNATVERPETRSERTQ